MQNSVSNFKKINSFLFLLFFVSACGPQSSNSAPELQTFPFDGVKLISPSITQNEDPASFSQPSYPISASQHLLLRLENFTDRASHVDLGTGHAVNVNITLKSAFDLTNARSHFQICPLLKNWMMLATWKRGHPFGTSGVWAKAGGDYDTSACITSSVTTTTTLSFDVTTWFTNTVKGRNINFGLALFSDLETPIFITGDSNETSPPSLSWME